MPPPSHRFAQLLAGRIGRILPPPFTVRAEGSEVNVYAGAGPLGGSAAASILDDEDGRTFEEKVECAARAVLGGVQDVVTEELAAQWPPDANGRMATEGARVDATRLHLWFGADESAPVIALDPIELAELMGR